jgi:hypothetical protein
MRNCGSASVPLAMKGIHTDTNSDGFADCDRLGMMPGWRAYILGRPEEGETLQAGMRYFGGGNVETRSYQWKRNGSNISGATALTYVLGSSDVDAEISVTVTVTNGLGSITGTSDAIGPVSAGEGGGVGTPTPLGVIDFENASYSWGGVSKSAGYLAGTDGPWAFDGSKLTAIGIEGEAYFGLLHEALAAAIAGTVMVLDYTSPTGSGISCELHDAPGFDTDAFFSVGALAAGIGDGNGGGSVTTENGTTSRAKVAFLMTADLQKVSNNGGAVVMCDPAVARTVEPNRAAFSVNTGSTLHSITFYDTEADLAALSAADLTPTT